LFISFIPATIALIEATKIVLASGYSALYQQEAVTGIGATSNVLAAFLVPSALFLLVGSRDSRSGIAVSSLIILSYSIIEFFLGDRSNAVMPLIAYAWLWHWTVRPLPKTILITSGMIVMFVVFPVVKETRDIAGYARSLAILINTFYSIDNPFVTVVHEMGGSMQTVAYTLDLVPGFRPFDIGQGYLYALLTIFPNLFWDVHPTIARGLAATWLTKTVAPYIASIGGGLGYSFIAEAYLNFGWLGAPVALGLIGFFYGKFVLWAQQSREPAKMATVAAFTAFFLFYARGESGSMVRLLVWYALLPYGLCHYVSRLTLKGKKRS
jgi:oligosaccharide repeat unit polymerase